MGTTRETVFFSVVMDWLFGNRWGFILQGHRLAVTQRPRELSRYGTVNDTRD